uniref:Uncharacterized protein n=1 Tax=Neolamprologus brichardi TaxID=32507 RepID=A0A3Q4MLD6_NEOBR
MLEIYRFVRHMVNLTSPVIEYAQPPCQKKTTGVNKTFFFCVLQTLKLFSKRNSLHLM